MKTAFEFVLEKAPWAVRWVFYIFWAGLVVMINIAIFGWDAREYVDNHTRAIAEDVYDEKSAPRIMLRDQQYHYLSNEIVLLKSEMRNIGSVVYRIDGKLDEALKHRR